MTKLKPALSIDTDQSESSGPTRSPSPLEFGQWKGYHRLRTKSEVPSLRTGYLIVTASIVFMVLGTYATFLSAIAPQTGWKLLDVIGQDAHYKYFIILLVPTTAYFVIANWVGWQYYSNS